MAQIAVAVQDINRTGLAPTYTGSLLTTNNYRIPNDGKVFIHAKKSAAVDAVATIVTNSTVDGLAVPDKTVTVPNTDADGLFFGPFPVSIYGASLDVSFDNIDGLSIAALRVNG